MLGEEGIGKGDDMGWTSIPPWSERRGGNNTYNLYHATEMRAQKLSTDFFSFKDGREIKKQRGAY